MSTPNDWAVVICPMVDRKARRDAFDTAEWHKPPSAGQRLIQATNEERLRLLALDRLEAKRKS
jgi:hypothetical protein